MPIQIKGWSHFQHFKDRRPPWIKLYRELLDDVDWHELDPKAAKALVMFWLIASENDGTLPDDKTLAFRLRTTTTEIKSLISKLSHWLVQDDISVISTRYQGDTPETETETKKRERQNTQAPEGVSVEVWDSFVQQRKKARAVVTTNVVETIAKEAAKANWTLEEALAECAARGWRGFKAEWVKPKHDPSLDTYFDN